MAERYNKLYTLPGNLYAAGSPVIISAGALLKDNQSGKVLCQLKFRSISGGTINALKLLVTGYDMSGEQVCSVEHQYLDLKVGRNGVFGAKEAIPLPERSVRSYEAQVLAVFFADGERWFADEQMWEPLPEQPHLRTRLFDRELIRQYKLDTSEKSENVPMEYKDLWVCSCGEYNHPEEDCFSCGRALGDLQYFLNVDVLLEEKNARLMAEAKLAAERESSREKSGKIIKRVLLVILPLLLIAGVAWFFYNRSLQRETDYEMAGVLFAAEKYSEAAAAYDELGDYKDSTAKANEARAILSDMNSYEKAGKFMENGRYDDAYNAYSALGDYLDAPQLAKEALYRKATGMAGEGLCDEARELFLSLGDYSDSALMADSFIRQLVSTETSYDAECEGPLTTTYSYDDAGRLAVKTALYSVYDGLNDRVLEYAWNGDGSYTETEGSTVRAYDSYGVLQSVDGLESYVYDYGFYDSGALHYVGKYAVQTNDYLGETVYDEQGNVIRYTHEDGSTSTVVNEYDEQGRLVKQENFDPSGAFVDRTSYEYDDEGYLKRSTYMDLENTTSVTNFSYEIKFAPGSSAS